MEYSIVDLPKAVYYILTLNPNMRYSMDAMYNAILKEGACPEFTNGYYTRYGGGQQLVEACIKASQTYENVAFTGGECYLKVKLDNYDMCEIERIVKNPSTYHEPFDKPYAAGQTILHILCKERSNQLLDELSKSYKIDVMARNDKGESLLDVIPVDSQETVKTLFKITLNQMREAQNTVVSEIKSKNTDLLKANNCLNCELANLRNYKTTMDARINTIYFVMLSMAVVLVGVCYTVFN